MGDKRTQPESVLQVPEILKRIDALRLRLAGTDRADHLAEIAEWEKKAKKSLILLSLQKHEGVPMIIEKAKEEIRLCYEKLRERPEEKDPTLYTRERQFIFDRLDLWTWFLNLFTDAESEIKALEATLEYELAPVDDSV